VAYINGSKVGYTCTAAVPAAADDPAAERLFHVSSHSQLQLKRFGQLTSQQMDLASWETADGRIVRLETTMVNETTTLTTKGRVQGDSLELVTTTLGKSQRAEIPWRASCGGFFAVEHSLSRSPMAPGQQRSFQALMPVLNQLGDIRLEALEYETTELLRGSQRLLKIRSIVELGRQKIESFLWTNEAGETLKSLIPGIGQVSYRATKQEALETTEQVQYDLGEASMVKVGRLLERPHDTRRVVYRATLSQGDPQEVFVSCPTQRVRSIDGQTAEIEVRSIQLAHADDPAGRGGDAPNEDDLAANNLIQSDAPAVVAMASGAAPGEQDPWKTAVALERLVHQSMRKVGFSHAFATAAEVAENLQGDCTEHAVLLAALCRARRIPARVAMGLVYYAADNAFAYHMWNEVWADGRWKPLDATLGRGGIGGAHIKLCHSNLKGVDAYGAFLPVFQVLGRLQLEIVEVEHGPPPAAQGWRSRSPAPLDPQSPTWRPPTAVHTTQSLGRSG
jgi:hypothetical protein